MSYPLFHGTHAVQVPEILRTSLAPSGGHSPHTTLTTDAIFLSDDIIGGVRYGFHDEAIAVLEVNIPAGTTLLPDTDDIGPKIDDELSEFNYVIKDHEYHIGDHILPAHWDLALSFVEDSERQGVLGITEDGRLEAVPWVLVPVNQDDVYSGKRIDLDDYPQLVWMDGMPFITFQQWMCKCSISGSYIPRVWMNEEAGKLMYLKPEEIRGYERTSITNYWDPELLHDQAEEAIFKEETLYGVPAYVILDRYLREQEQVLARYRAKRRQQP
jgi:hypothetical protein